MPTVTIFGSAAPQPGTPDYQQAYQLGQAAARAGWSVCNGGYGGTMEASAAGARAAGGHTIGVTCQPLGRSGPNRWIVEEVPSESLLQRLEQLVLRGDAFVALPGATGTLLEIALVWELQAKQLLPARPLWLLGSVWEDLVRLLPEVPLAPRCAADLESVCRALQFPLEPGN